MLRINNSGFTHIFSLLMIFTLLAIGGVFFIVKSSNDSTSVLGASTSSATPADDTTSPFNRPTGYAIVTRKYKDFDFAYAQQKGLKSGMYPKVAKNHEVPCVVLKNETINKGRGSRTLWQCEEGVWYVFPNDADPNSPLTKAYKIGSVNSKYTVRVNIKAGKTVKARTLTLRKSDL